MRYEIRTHEIVDLTEEHVVQARGHEIQHLICSNCNNLVSLKGCPNQLKTLSLSFTGLETFEFCPSNVNIIFVYKCPRLQTLKGIPQQLITLSLWGTPIKSLDDISISIKNDFVISKCPNLTFRQIWKNIRESKRCGLRLKINQKIHLLGFLRIAALQSMQGDDERIDIINKYLPVMTMSSILQCKQELIEAGFVTNAKF